MNKEYKEQYIVVAPYWNVNVWIAINPPPNHLIVVAPYWNVNEDGIVGNEERVEIVVAPYWNVNVNKLATAPIALPHSSSSILECKCWYKW